MPKKSREHRLANPELAAAMRALRSSNVTQPHIPTPDKGTRRARQRAAIQDQRRDQENTHG